MAACSVDGCNTKATALGWCPKHRWRWKKYVSLEIRNPRDVPPDVRFWLRVERSEGCWLWTGSCSGDGYGAFSVEGRQYGAHRFSYELNHGRIPTGMVVMHSCDVPRCVNPAHLSLGTFADNAADSARKARRPRGSKNSQAKLTEGQVLQIRTKYAEGGITMPELARAYGVSCSLINAVVSRRAWKHI